MHITHQIPNLPKSVKRLQDYLFTCRFKHFCNAGQPFLTVNLAGAGAAGGMMAGMAVHQRRILFKPDLFQAIQNAHGFIHGQLELLKLGWIDHCRLVAQDFKRDFLFCHILTGKQKVYISLRLSRLCGESYFFALKSVKKMTIM